jgi:glucose-6-phosphate 1-dehydrogenase
MVENILFFRFVNNLFEPVWSDKYIESIHIRLFEKTDVRGREAFYDGTGALRDVGQNHMLQMLALVTQNQPKKYTPNNLQKEREKIFNAFELYTKKSISQTERKQLKGYTDHAEIPKKSRTETYFKVPVHIKNSRWQNTSFILESGKGLAENRVSIAVQFRGPQHCLIEQGVAHAAFGSQHVANRIEFEIQPNPSIKMTINSLGDSLEREVVPNEFTLPFHEESFDEIPDAYEKLLLDAIRGEKYLFPSNEEEMASWKFIMSIIKNWDTVPLRKYEKGLKLTD